MHPHRGLPPAPLCMWYQTSIRHVAYRPWYHRRQFRSESAQLTIPESLRSDRLPAALVPPRSASWDKFPGSAILSRFAIAGAAACSFPSLHRWLPYCTVQSGARSFAAWLPQRPLDRPKTHLPVSYIPEYNRRSQGRLRPL